MALAENAQPELPSPEDDLDCALFLAQELGRSFQEMSEEERRGYSSAYMYFVGRYEAVRGTGIGPAMVERDEMMRVANLDLLAEQCGQRLDEMKVRVSEYAELMNAAAPSGGKSADDAPAETD